MAEIELLLPKMGESVSEATIIKWVVDEGQTVEADDSLVEIATDKVDSEVPAPEDGVLLKRLVNDGDVVQVGDPIAIISTGASSDASITTPKEEAKVENTPSDEVLKTIQAPIENVVIEKTSTSGKFFSPLVRKIAQEEQVTVEELEAITGSGKDNRVTKNDILAYVESRKNGKPLKTASSTPADTNQSTAKQSVVAPPQKTKTPAVSIGPNDEIVEMDRMRKLIAQHMVNSVATSAHVTSFVEADVTNLVLWRNKNKAAFQEKYGQKITFTPLIFEAVIKAINDFPGVNVSLDGDNIVYHHDINLGMAAALPNGNLIVPVIKNADQLNLVGLTSKVNDLANRARNNQLAPDEISGGTYTVTNVGTFGNVMGTPIINQPQVAILAAGAIRKKPAVIETPQGDTIGIRHQMFLSHSYDHRIVDGMLGGMFVRKVADYLEAFDLNRDI